MKKIKISDCTSVEICVDLTGKLFFFEGRVLRAINDNYISQVRDMFDCGLIENITRRKIFPETWISDVTIEGYSLVVEHERIMHWNYPYEWCFDMLKDAALTVLELNEIAGKYGYQIMDGHAYNVVFNMGQPQYVDFGSFCRLENDSVWSGYVFFENHFYIPMYIWSQGCSDISRNIFLMSDYFDKKNFLRIKYPILFLINSNYLINLIKNFEKLSFISSNTIKEKIQSKGMQKIVFFINKFYRKKLNGIKKTISAMTPSVEKTIWKDYHGNLDAKTNKRFLRIKQIIDELTDASSMLELASNQGKFSQLIIEETHIKYVIATDYDKEAVNIMYLNNRKKNNFLPLIFDIVRPNARKKDIEFTERVKSDIVVALAITHHLILSQNISIDWIFDRLKKLTKKYVIVEFMPLGLYSGNLSSIPSVPDFYNLYWFKENFNKNFELLLEEELEINRHLFVGKLP